MPPARVLLLLTSLALLASCEAVYVYSSFWAPLFDRRVLSYRVDAPFDPDSAWGAREHYKQHYGYRGEKLVADLGNGKAPGNVPRDIKMYGDVKFYYT